MAPPPPNAQNTAEPETSPRTVEPTLSGLLDRDCEDSLQFIRRSLIELYASVDADPSTPQVVSRRFGLNKNLTWKLSKIINAEDSFSAIPHLPGAAGVDIAIRAFRKAGAPAAALDRVRDAVDSFDKVVTVHAGNRENLDLILDSMGLGNTERPLETSRQLAYRGNSGICGVQARTRVVAAFVRPLAERPDLVDSALVAGFVDFRRLRPNVRWPLFRFMSYTGSSGAVTGMRRFDPLIPARGGEPMLTEFCSQDLPEIDISTDGDVTEYTLTGGRVGNLGAFDCFFGHRAQGDALYRTPEDPYGEFSTAIGLPIENLIFDLFIHRDIPFTERPNVRAYSRAGGMPDDPARRRDDQLLPLRLQMADVPGSPPNVATPLFSKYSALVDRVSGVLGTTPSDYRVLRLSVAVPPMPSTIVVRWPLPEQPGASA